MGLLLAKDKTAFDATQGCVTGWRQAVGFGLPQIDNQPDADRSARSGADQADTPRLDQPADRGGAGRNKAAFPDGKPGAVIGHQPRAQRHQRQPQRRLARG